MKDNTDLLYGHFYDLSRVATSLKNALDNVKASRGSHEDYLVAQGMEHELPTSLTGILNLELSIMAQNSDIWTLLAPPALVEGIGSGVSAFQVAG
ncbi:hypothetical protein N7520_008861 [Penicillium odoratum]|uniref:uncharacterized protein n=1 Tax=Penicillium odoratum TaxID=1167516 RepID=UPI0025466138|nr:uncharacterized protein N7520_008861 [Penicillium odoratum]KAJ5751944.1 hypothetical protein N7520_008861 [Penicillium odoratum]